MKKDIFHIHNVYDQLQRRRMQIAIAIVCVVIGMLLVTQLQVQKSISKKLQEETKQDLGEIIRDLDIEVRALQKEERDLELRLVKYQGTAEDQWFILNEAAQNLENLKMFAGLVGIEGEGVQVVIGDEHKFLDCYNLWDIANELKAGGAEAISINGVRVAAMTSFTNDSEGRVVVGGVKVEPPYVIKTIGDPKTLSEAVGLLGGIQYTLTSYEGVTFNVTEIKNIGVPAV